MLWLVVWTTVILLLCHAHPHPFQHQPTRRNVSEFTDTSHFFKKIGEWEIIKISHSELHSIDDYNEPLYPPNAVIRFHAHNTHFKLLLRQNHELFADNFQVTNYNHSGNHERVDWDYRKNKCFYHGDVLVNGTLSTARPFLAGLHMSTCKGMGVRGTFYIDGEAFTIEPAKVHISPIEKDAYTHRLDHDYIVYKQSSLHHSVRPEGDFCGHEHPTNPIRMESPIKIDEHHHLRVVSSSKRKLQQSNQIKYVELLVVNDPARCSRFSGSTPLISDTIGIVNGVTSRYRAAAFDPTNVGTVQVVLINIQNWCNMGFPAGFAPLIVNKAPQGSNAPATPASCASCYDQAIFSDSGSNSYEIEYNSFLTQWQNWRIAGQGVPEHDNGHLFSGYDFYSSVIGYASIPGMCIAAQSGGINQMTYSTDYNSAVVAHEMGHNFAMQHDSIGNTCSERGDIMAAVGDTSTAPSSFSSCSINYLNSFFQSMGTSCLNNQPTGATYATCRNGFKEQGEFCDCGSHDCTTVDACCDGNLCQLFADAKCSSRDGCCDENCKLKAVGTLCRAKDVTNFCDIGPEYCEGAAECPPDKFFVEGTECQPTGTTSEATRGMCYQQRCVTWNDQCAQSGGRLQPLDAPWTSCSASPHSGYSTGTLTEPCASLRCQGRGQVTCNPLQAGILNAQAGTPCGLVQGGVVAQQQCKNGVCQNSAQILSSRWIAFPWSNCTKDCVTEAGQPPGTQSRGVICALQNGTQIADSICNAEVGGEDNKPIANQTCNNFLCTFCRLRSDGQQKCAPNGVCDAVNQRCNCFPGFAGPNCDVTPFLNLTGITRRQYDKRGSCTEMSQVSVEAGGNFTNCSDVCNQQAVGQNFVVSNATHLGQRFFNISVTRGNTTVNLTVVNERCECTVFWPDILQTVTEVADPNNSISAPSGCFTSLIRRPGVKSLDAIPNYMFERGDFIELEWNTQGSLDRLAVSLEDRNPQRRWVWNHYVSSSLAIGTDNKYRFQIPDDIYPGIYRVLLKFNNEQTNFRYTEPIRIVCSEYRCNRAGHGRCDNSTGQCVCDPGWYGTLCAESNCKNWALRPIGADALTASQIRPRCLVPNATCNAFGNPSCTCGHHYTGPYCELPLDGCRMHSTSGPCDNDYLCSWAGSQCLYTECLSLNTTQCGSSGACYWDTGTGLCKRETCSDQSGHLGTEARKLLPACQLGSLRRAVSASQSICAGGAWYCDCTLAPNISSASQIVTAQLSDLGTGSNITTTEVLTCQKCNLNCTGNSVKDALCTKCLGCDLNFLGINCDRRYWVGSFDISIPHNIATGVNKPEFDALVVKDLAFVFRFTDVQRISIWQVKPSASGSTVFFEIQWLTSKQSEAQAQGGFVMKGFKDIVAQPTSEMYRGVITNSTNPGVAFKWCLPYFEECDTSRQADVVQILLICAGSSFGLMIAIIVVYRIVTAPRRQRRYEQKVRDVKNAQLKLMDMHNHRAKRVGMKDVTKARARKISRARHQRKAEDKKIRKQEEKNQRRLSQLKEEEIAAGVRPHARSDSGIQLAEIEENDEPGGMGEGGGFGNDAFLGSGGGGEGAPMAFGQPQQHSFDPNHVPPPWETFYNPQGIPYYHNAQTGATSWIHPYEQ